MVGEFESTLLKAFIRNARLRQWMSRPDIPGPLRMCAKIFDRLFGRTDYTRGEEDELEEEEVLINSQVCCSFLCFLLILIVLAA